MNYRTASRRFDLDKTILKLSDYSLGDMMVYVQREIITLEKIVIPVKEPDRKSIESMKSTYMKDLKGLAFMLNGHGNPSSIDDEKIEKFRTLIDKKIKS